MKLIDADEIAWVDSYYSDGDKKPYKIAYSDELPPTVDAIPIKWLLEQAENPSNTDAIRNAIDYIVYTLWAERKEK